MCDNSAAKAIQEDPYYLSGMLDKFVDKQETDWSCQEGPGRSARR